MTYYRAEYERNNKRIKSKRGRQMKNKRMSTVEPVFGTLTQYMGMRKINTRGLAQANKVMHMAAIAYNLKKLMKWTQKQRKTGAKANLFLKNRNSQLMNTIMTLCDLKLMLKTLESTIQKGLKQA